MPEDIKRSIYNDLGLEKNGVDFNQFITKFDQDAELRKSVFDDLGLESNGVSFDSFEDKLGFKKKVQSELSFAQRFMATPSTGEPTLSTVSQSPLKLQTNISPSGSIGKESNNTLSFKPNLTIPWDKAPAGSEIKKEDKNADYLRVKQQPSLENKPFVDYETDRLFKSLPAITQVAFNKDPQFKSNFLNYLKQNPETSAKIQAWSKNKDATGQSIIAEEIGKFSNQEVQAYIPKLQELEASGVGQQLQAAQDFYANFNTAIDDLKTKKTKLEFYQNNFIESKGYKDVVDESKVLNSKVKEFNIDAWKADSEKLLANIEQTKAEVQKYVVNDAVPREYQDAYAKAYGEYEYAVNIYNEHANIPELKEYNNDIKSLEGLKLESEDLLKEFSGNSAYKKAKEDYEASLARVESMKPQADEFKAQQPIFNDYIQTAKTVSGLVEKIELANKGFPAPISMQETRERITKLYNEGYMNEATLRNWAGVLESLPKAVNSILSGVGSTLSALTFGQAGEYNAYDKMADYYDGLNKYNTTILPTMQAYKTLKDGSTKWDLAAVGFQGLQQIGNMAVFATLGGYGKGAMVVTGYMMSRKERENEADEAGLTGMQKEAYISTLSTLEGLSELIMPDNQIFTKQVKEMLLKDAVLAQTKGINWFRKQAFKRIAENTSKEIAEEWVVSIGELMQKVAINYDNGNVFDVSKYKDMNSWIETAAVTAPLTFLASGRSEINIPKIELEQARFQAARNLTKSREILDEMVDTGNMTVEKADSEYKKIVNYAAVQSVMPKDISPAKAVEVAPLIIENKKLEILAESGIDEVFKKQINEQIKQNVAKAEEILSRPEEVELINNEDLEVGLTEAELLRPEEEAAQEGESKKKFYQGREFIESTGLKPDYYTPEEVEAAKAAKAKGIQEAPAIEGQKTENELKVEELRAQEQAERDATDPNDQEKLDEIYNRYDKLITPLLEGTEAEQVQTTLSPEAQQLEGLVNQIPTEELRRPNGSIGTQGFTAENLVDLARFISNEMGFDIPAFDSSLGTSEARQVIDYLKGNKEAQQKIKEYVIKDPVLVSQMPDGSYSIADGNHRANLLNLIGVEAIPTIELNGRTNEAAIKEHKNAVEKILGTKEQAPVEAKPAETAKVEKPIKEKEDEFVEIPEDELAALEQEIEEQKIEGNVKENIGQKAYLGEKEGMIKMHDTEKNTVVFETNDQIIDLGQLDSVSGRPIVSFGLSKFPQEGIKTEPKTGKEVRAVKLDGKEYEIVGRARDKKGLAVVKLKEKGTGLIRRLKGEKAERVLKDFSLQTSPKAPSVRLKVEGKEAPVGKTEKELKLEEKARKSDERRKAREAFQEKTLDELKQEEAKSEKLIQDFEKQALEEAVKNAKKSNLVQVGDKIFQVNKKADGSFSVSQMREDGKMVGIKDEKSRKEAIEAFGQERSRKESEELAKAQKLIEDFKSEEKDRFEALLDKAIKSLDSKGRAFDATIGLPIFVAKSALKIIKLSYKAGKSLSEAIADGYKHIKDMGYTSVSEFDFKEYMLGQLSGKPRTEVATPKQQATVETEKVSEIPANVVDIAEKVGEPANKVQNLYNKYGDKTKDISEITEEDYEKAKDNREKVKKGIRQKAIEVRLAQQNLTSIESKKEQKQIESLKKQDYKEVKKVDDFMELLPDLQKAMLKTGDITTNCKWGK
jgi:hypothetical protein